MSFSNLRLLLGLTFCALTLALGACGHSHSDDDDDDSADDDDDDDSVPVEFAMWSPDFIDDENITHNYDCEQALPVEFSCDGSNPEIVWEGAPEGTVAFTLIFDDPTAGNFPHWAIYNIPASETGLAAGISGNNLTNTPPGDAIELDNGFGWNGYLGSCPGGVNHYRWRLWALSSLIDSSSASNYSTLAGAADSVALDMVEMCHVFDGSQIPVGR